MLHRTTSAFCSRLASASARMCLGSALVLCGTTVNAKAKAIPVSEAESSDWCDHLVPLPHQIAIPWQVIMPRANVEVRLQSHAGDIEKQAALELAELLGGKGHQATPRTTAFQLLIGVVDEDGRIGDVLVKGVEKLSELPSAAQSYAIEPVGTSTLVVAALDPKGVYYGVQTLKQLLSAKLTDRDVVIPLATIVDWPDMEERGLWNFDLDLIPWLTSLKLNFAKVPTRCEPLRRGEPVRASLVATERFPDVLAAGRVRALKAVPNVAHLNYIGAKHGGYDAYPELAGKGEEAVPTIWYEPRRIRVPCGACPMLTQIIAEYLLDLASKGASEVSVWLSEFAGQCQCPTCLEAGQLRMETRAACQAWRAVRKQYPNLVMRIFYCMGGKSLEDTCSVLGELPPEVKIERCYGQYGEAFDKAARAGRWLASYAGPPLPRVEHSGLRFHGASQTRDYVRSLRDRQWAGVYSINYVYSKGSYQRGIFGFHVHALAEWTWNTDGRDLRQLGKAWATRAGYAAPDKVAEWIALMDPIERALHYALTTRNWAEIPKASKDKAKLRPGHGVLAGFPNAATLKMHSDGCQRALSIAENIGAQDLVIETKYVVALLQTLAALNAISTAARPDGSPSTEIAELRRGLIAMLRTFNAQMDLLNVEPKAFGESSKKNHSEMWRERVEAIVEAFLPHE